MQESKLVIKPKRMRGDDGYKTFSIRIRDELVLEIDDIASRSGRSRNELVGILLSYALKHCTVEE